MSELIDLAQVQVYRNIRYVENLRIGPYMFNPLIPNSAHVNINDDYYYYYCFYVYITEFYIYK